MTILLLKRRELQCPSAEYTFQRASLPIYIVTFFMEFLLQMCCCRNVHYLKISDSSGVSVFGCHGREDVPFLPMSEIFVYQLHPLTKRHICHLGVIFFVCRPIFFLKIVLKLLIDFATQ